jgi:hypothetical protein
MLTLLSAERGPRGVIRRYQHPELGVLAVLTMFGSHGSADFINLDFALRHARCRLKLIDDEARQRAEQKRGAGPPRGAPPRKRRSSQSDPQPAA